MIAILRLVLAAPRLMGDAFDVVTAPLRLLTTPCMRCCDSLDEDAYYPEDGGAYPAVPQAQYGDDDDSDDDNYGVRKKGRRCCCPTVTPPSPPHFLCMHARLRTERLCNAQGIVNGE